MNIYSKLRRAISGNTLLNNMLIIASGTAGAQLLTIMCSPVISRLYSPQAIGILGSFLALISILIPLASLSLPMALILPRTEQRVNRLVILSIYLTLVASLLSLIVMSLLPINLLGAMQLDNVAWVPLVFSLYLLSTTIFELFTFWALRKGYFSINAKVVIIQSILTNGGKILAGIFIDRLDTLVLITVLSGMISITVYAFFMRKLIISACGTVKLNRKIVKGLCFKYDDFIKYRTPQRLISGVNQSAPIILLAIFFDSTAAGFFTLCRSTLMLPVNLISKSVNDALYPKLAELNRQGKEIHLLMLKATLWLCLVGLVPLVLMLLLAPWLFHFIFGESWYRAGEYAQWFSIWLFFNFINRPSVAAIPILNLEKLLLLNSSLNFFLVLAGFYIGHTKGSDITAIALFSIFGILPQLIIIITSHISAIKMQRQS